MTGEGAATTKDRTLAPLIVGITGKVDLRGAAAAVRAAVDLAFAELDARCPTTPKLLLTSLAQGADTVAAEAALARADWRVIAVLPLEHDLLVEDFEGPARQRLETLLANPRLKPLTVERLREKASGGALTSDAKLARTAGAAGAAGAARADHYEQAGLFISERAAIMLAVMDADEAPGKVGGTARVVRNRLTGELDAPARDIVARSCALEAPPRLVDRRTGPVWLIDLGALVEAPAAPSDAFRVWIAGYGEPSLPGDARSLAASLALADSLEGVNRSIAGMSADEWAAVERRAGADQGDAVSFLRRVRAALAAVQADTVSRVRLSIWALAVLSCVAIVFFELYVDEPGMRSRWLLSALYPLVVLIAVALYGWAARRRWQRFAEDYRAAAEAWRVQLVWWESGLTSAADRVERFYLRGSHGALKQLKGLISAVTDAALLFYGPPAQNADAVETWVASQLDFFERRIVSRRRRLLWTETTSWFLFAGSLGVAGCLALSQHDPSAGATLDAIIGLSAALRWMIVGAALALAATLLPLAIRNRDAKEAAAPLTAASVSNIPAMIAGGLAGVLLVAAVIAGSALHAPSAHQPTHLAVVATREAIAILVIVPATVAGALRFVSEKSSWTAELTGYEHALDHLRRGERALAADGADDPVERRELIVALGVEALIENENWLRSHRERPLEPIVGG